MSEKEYEIEIVHGMGDLGKSRSQKKRESAALQAMGEKLGALPDARLEELGLSIDLLGAIRDLRSIKKHEARRRQNQLIGRYMRELDEEDHERIALFLDSLDKQRQFEAQGFQELEAVRDALLDPDRREDELRKIAEAHPLAEIKKIRHLAAGAAAERPSGKNKMYRELFRYLKGLE